jgi:VanZ family protein
MFARFTAWLVLTVIIVITFVPPAFRPVSMFPHFAEHFAIFLVAGGSIAIGYSQSKPTMLISAIAFAAALEALQLFVPGRHARLSDFVIDALAACMGIMLVLMLPNARRSRTAASQQP